MKTGLLKNVTRKCNKIISFRQNYFLRFNGISFKTEPSSKFSHRETDALGSYRNSPFVTGSLILDPVYSGLKTEILDYKAQKWTEVKEYPFTKERLREKKFLEVPSWNYCK